MVDKLYRTESVEFASGDCVLRGTLYIAGRDEGERGPAAVVAGSWTTVKEQMAGRYAAELAARGLTALAFDFRHYGESDGQPREFESPESKVADIVAAVDFLSNHPAVDADRIGALGVCAGAGYVCVAAARDERIRALALVAPWLHDAELVRAVYGGEDGVREKIEAGQRARVRWEETGQVEYVPAVSDTDPTAAMYGPIDYYLNAARGAIEQWPNRLATMSWPTWLTFDPISVAPQVDVPLLAVHSEDAAIPDGIRRFADKVSGPCELRWRSGTQFDFYDDDATVDDAVTAAAEHLSARL
ncbi:alpha/beta hydrolase [Kutzneria kofuensis]|uniref:Serine aminopeptidase S33 domain-containing protein n=1 Tax=Kutzneria kofuensis TaxID=103725 RepID=A0A7W9KS95_9PSEU|nr:alpha/beta fold hydrolase [Kutzneria kofuensis]MBB5897004.1 hypothetical protein [Kutzneria kofuensis]